MLQLLQISDLHIGLPDDTGQPPFDAEVLAWWAAHPLFDGYLGHTWAALEQLETLLLDLRAEARAVGAQFAVIVTGDITRTGNEDEYDTALRYLDTGLLNGPGLRLKSVNGDNARDFYIPGNHDHWPGQRCDFLNMLSCIQGGPTRGLSWLGTYPRVLPPLEIENGTMLRLCAIDTDAEIDPNGFDRLLARGHFPNQCTEAAALLSEPPRPKELRGLLIHHSPVVGYRMGISHRSRIALENLIEDAQIDLLFTGHCHTAVAARFERNSPGRRPLELRCGTTTQRDEWPITLPRMIAGARRMWSRPLPQNSALLHEFSVEQGRIALKTTEYRRYAGGFEPFWVLASEGF